VDVIRREKTFDLEVELGAVDAVKGIVETLGKINSQYFSLNYIPHGGISVADLIRKGGTANEAGSGISNIMDGKTVEVDPEDVVK